MGLISKWGSLGSIAPLFDRLCDDDPDQTDEPVPFINYNRQELVASILHEIDNILNTRFKLSAKEYDIFQKEKLPYGVPDFYGFPDQSYADPLTPKGRIKLASRISECILTYEPRLKDIRIDLEAYEQESQSIQINVSGTLLYDNVFEPISFPVSLKGFEKSGQAERTSYDK